MLLPVVILQRLALYFDAINQTFIFSVKIIHQNEDEVYREPIQMQMVLFFF